VSPDRTKAGEIQETAYIVFADPVRFHEPCAKAEFAGQFKDRLPEVVVIDDDQAGLGCAVSSDLDQSAENIEGVENVIEQHIVEGLVQIEVFRVGLDEFQGGVVPAGALHHGLTDFHPYASGGLDGGEHVASLAAHVEDAATGLDDEAQQALDTVVVVAVRTNPVVAVFGDIVLLLLSPIAKLLESLRPPIPCPRS
jgi:hypothetical protein